MRPRTPPAADDDPALLMAVASLPPGHARGQDAIVAEANKVVELTFTAHREHPDPFRTVDLDVTFTTPSGRKVRVPAFWAGGKTWRVRYASPEIGVHTYDQRLHRPARRRAARGARTRGGSSLPGRQPALPAWPDPRRVRPAALRARRRHAVLLAGRHLVDGALRAAALAGRVRGRWPRIARRRASRVIQIVAGLYPDMPAFDPRGTNEAGFPWSRELRLDPARVLRSRGRRINDLVDHGLVPCVVMAWGYHLPWTGPEKMKKHVRYVMARYGALPVRRGAWPAR